MVPAHPGSPGKRAVKRVCVCVCVFVCVCVLHPVRFAISPPLATVRVKDKMCHEECRQGAHLPSLGREPLDKPLNSATHGQSDARPTVTFPAAGHHRPLTGTELNCLATEAHVCEQLAHGCYLKPAWPGVEPATC